jgi:hypothetical protein
VRPRRRTLVLALVAADVVGTLVARARGYGVGGETIVRCRRGHLFATLWIPGASLKAIRLGWWRVQRCPVGRHWSLVGPVRAVDLTPDELRRARATHDLRIP